MVFGQTTMGSAVECRQVLDRKATLLTTSDVDIGTHFMIVEGNVLGDNNNLNRPVPLNTCPQAKYCAVETRERAEAGKGCLSWGALQKGNGDYA